MATQVSEILTRASIILQDAGGVRWPYIELLDWINRGVAEISVLKPTALGETIELTLVKGTLQKLPSNYHLLLAVNRNLATLSESPEGRTGGRAITVVPRDDLDAQIPDWHDSSVLPFTKTVLHMIEHESDQASFFVAPGNDGTGTIEVVASHLPPAVLPPETPLILASYTDDVPLTSQPCVSDSRSLPIGTGIWSAM